MDNPVPAKFFLGAGQIFSNLPSQIELIPSDDPEVIDIDPMSFSTNSVSNCKIQLRIFS